jgi:hypothetical protein
MKTMPLIQYDILERSRLQYSISLKDGFVWNGFRTKFY